MSAFALDHLAEQTGLSARAAAAQLGRLAPGVVPLHARATYYLIVPPEYRRIGAPPVSWWIDGYFTWQKEPYYLALLTAAAHHGASHQAAQVVQVVIGRSRRTITIGRQKLSFVMKKAIRLPAGSQVLALQRRYSAGHPRVRADRARAPACSSTTAVHPRVRGEQGQTNYDHVAFTGSSPRARGTVCTLLDRKSTRLNSSH